MYFRALAKNRRACIRDNLARKRKHTVALPCFFTHPALTLRD